MNGSTLLPALLITTTGIFSIVVYEGDLFDLVEWQNIEFGPWTVLAMLATIVAIALVIEGVVKLSNSISRSGRR